MRSQEAVMQMVTDNRSAMGYVDRSKTNSQVKTVLELDEK
jgi:hypothetical protein